MTRTVVIDTSALLSSHEHDDHAQLERLHARAEVIAPVLIGFEAGQVVHAKRPGAFADSPTKRGAYVETLLEGIGLVTPDAGAWARIGELAEQEKLSFYDAAFLDLAIERDAALLTEDDRLAKAALRRLGKTRVMRLGR